MENSERYRQADINDAKSDVNLAAQCAKEEGVFDVMGLQRVPSAEELQKNETRDAIRSAYEAGKFSPDQENYADQLFASIQAYEYANDDSEENNRVAA